MWRAVCNAPFPMTSRISSRMTSRISSRERLRPLRATAGAVLLAICGGVEGSRAAWAEADTPVPVPQDAKDAVSFASDLPPGAPAERLAYRWRLQGAAGALAGLFFPRRGEGMLREGVLPDGKHRSDLLITSQDSGKGEFWSYGAEFDPATSNTHRAWSSYVFRGKRQAKSQNIDEHGITDITAGIHRLRRERPRTAIRQRIWSDGKVYNVNVTPLGSENLVLLKGSARPLTDRYAIEGIAAPGERLWKGRIELWLARDERATPLQILIERGWASVLLQLEGEPPVAAASPAVPPHSPAN
jgi:hypothetical protein